MLRRVMASRPAVTCSPEATTTSYSSSDRARPGAAAPAPSVQATSSLVLPAMAETTTATLRPACDLGGDEARDAADALQVGHGRAAELHHQARHRGVNRPVCKPRPGRSSLEPWPLLVDTRPAREAPPPQEILADGASGASHRPGRRRRASRPRPPNGGTPKGQFAPLHKFNPARLAFIRDQAAARFGRDVRSARSRSRACRLLDIGCGGGLLAEPMSRLGFAVTAVDASAENIGTARAHAEPQGLAIDLPRRHGRAAGGRGAPGPSTWS